MLEQVCAQVWWATDGWVMGTDAEVSAAKEKQGKRHMQAGAEGVEA